DVMPEYLSESNQTFATIIDPVLQTSASAIHIGDLQQIALLYHKLQLIELNISLWTTYLRSGTGKLHDNEQQPLLPLQATATAGVTTTSVGPHILTWPQELKTIMLADPTMKFHANEIDHDQSLNYVMKMLRSFREQNTHYQLQLKERKQRLNNCFTIEMEQVIQSFVRTYGTRSHRLH
ncbi:unnamed protein product, partial [Adineta ricciae]